MPHELSATLADYGAGLDAALLLLEQIETLATRQRALPHSVDPVVLTPFIEERQRLLDALVTLEARLRPLRDHIAAHIAEARAVPGFAIVAERHRSAAAAVTRIVQVDQQSLDALQDADTQRRADAQTVEAAGQTLAAYKRVLEGPQSSAALMDRRG